MSRKLLATSSAIIVGLAATSSPTARSDITKNSTLTCKTAVNLVGSSQDGTFWILPHNEPEIGNYDWSTKRTVGSQWHVGRTLAGPDGVVYSLVGSSGDLRRFRWNGASWDVWNGAQFRMVGTGWGRYAQTEHRNKVTVDEKGRLYEINAAGELRVRIWTGDDATGNWTPETSAGGKALGTGWNQYNLIIAAGDGVLYARKPNGDLFRFRYHFGSDRFTQHGLRVGTGWAEAKHILSVGGDILYGTWPGSDGPLLWYRYYEDTNSWASGVGKKVGVRWYGELDVTADSNGCRLTGYPVPSRPAVPQRFDAPTTVRQGPDGKVSWFYVNSSGGLTVATQRYVGDYTFLEYNTFAEYHKFTGQPGAGLRQDGRFEVLANSYDDASFRGKTQQVKNGVWGTALTNQEGWMRSDPVLVRESDDTLSQYAVDDAGALWRRAQVAQNGPYSGWLKVVASGVTTDFTAVRNGTNVDLVARFTDNSVNTARVTNGVVGTWRTVGTDTTDRPAAVAHPNGDLQVFARRGNGVVHTQRESAGTFPGTWTALGSLTTRGSPAAVVRGNGLVELAARGTDNYVYQASQLAPSAGFGAWSVRYFEETATDPTGTVLASGDPIFTWRSPQGLILTSYINPGATFTGATAKR
ncbi:tachylectin-related carbohydrate-binding protein [Saccharothrix obliqua]|uniref:tachylectin-related carbohydrate-binding protein n=1 Tax=Saccharothrix obliqua TaxID=2861747 RepID=UPI001C5EBA6E|nr:tachylectin-related carbohydrate-binding protein [Saccharothrix obliqua]MBW4717326.1 hypothetical protein [Saccharothrix obliqua]